MSLLNDLYQNISSRFRSFSKKKEDEDLTQHRTQTITNYNAQNNLLERFKNFTAPALVTKPVQGYVPPAPKQSLPLGTPIQDRFNAFVNREKVDISGVMKRFTDWQAKNREWAQTAQVPEFLQPTARTVNRLEPLVEGTARSGFSDIYHGAQRAAKPNILDKGAGLSQAAYGAGKLASIPTGLFLVPATIASTDQSKYDPNDYARRASAGFVEGLSGSHVSNVPNKNLLFKIGNSSIEFDPIKGVGQMVGFVKNPINESIAGATKAFNIPLGNKTMQWLLTNGTRGGVENSIMTLPELPEGASNTEKAKYLAQAFGFGAVADIGTRGIGEAVSTLPGKAWNMVSESKKLKNLGEIFDDLLKVKKASLSTAPLEAPASMPGLKPDMAHPITENRISGVNFDNLDQTSSATQRGKEILTSLKSELEAVKGKVLTHTEVEEAAKQSDLLSGVISKEETLKAEAQVLKSRQAITALGESIDNALKSGDTTAAKNAYINLYQQLQNVSGWATDAGRRLESLKIIGSQVGTREQVLKSLAKIGADADLVAEKASKVNWDDARSVNSFYREFVKPSFDEVLTEYRYNNILSNPKTHARNFLGNLEQTLALRPAVKALSGDPVGAIKYYGGVLKSFPEALSAFGNAAQGKTIGSKFEVGQTPTGVLPGVFQIPTRLLEGSDQFFTKLITGGEIAAGKTGKEADTIAERALLRSSFDPQNKSGQGVLLSTIDKYAKGIDALRNVPGGKWVIPFIKTPVQVFKQWVEYSPAGLATLPGAINKREQLAKALIGSAVTVIGANLAAAGRTTWAAPTTEKEKQLFYGAGKKPYSVKIGEAWVPMQYFGVLGLSLAIPAAAKHYNENTSSALSDSWLEKLKDSGLSAIGFAVDQTPLDNVESFIGMLKGDASYSIGQTVGFTASQAIPMTGFLAYVQQITDPFYKKPKGIVESIKSRLPILSQDIKNYTNPDGTPSQREPINAVLPYDIGIENPLSSGYNARLRLSEQTRQQNNLESKQKSLLKEGDIEGYKQLVQSSAIAAQEEKPGLLGTINSVLTNLFSSKQQTATPPEELTALEKALKKQTDAADKESLIKAIMGSPASQADKKAALEASGISEEEANLTMMKSLTIEDSSRGDYIREVLKSTAPEDKMKMATYLATEEVLTKSVVNDWYKHGVISAQDKKGMDLMIDATQGIYPKATKKAVKKAPALDVSSVPKITSPRITAPKLRSLSITPPTFNTPRPTYQRGQELPARVQLAPLRYQGARTLQGLGGI